MQNLQQYRDKYRWNSGTSGEIVRAEVYYALGGTNAWANKQEPRGIWLSIMPLKIEDSGTPGIRFESFTVFGSKGRRIFLLELKRANPAKLAAIAEKLDADIPALAAQLMETGAIDLESLRTKVA
jgi:hypothetical protein